MQELLTEDLKIKYANDVDNAITHLLDMIRKIGHPLSVMICSDGTARIQLTNMRDVVDRAVGELNTVHRADVSYPWKYTREFNSTAYYAFDCGQEE